MRRFKRIACLLLLCLPLTGCVNDRQIEVQMPAVILGLDEAEDGMITLCVKIPLLGGKAEGQQSGGGSGGGGGGGSSGSKQQSDSSYALAEASGEAWGAALTALHATVPRDLNFSQLREIVFGERAAQSERFVEYYQNVCSLPSVRSDAYVVVCAGEASDFIKKQNARVGNLLSKYIDKTFTRLERMAYVPAVTLGEGQAQFYGSGSDPLFIYGSLDEKSKGNSAAEKDVTNAVAGEMKHQGLSETELFGAAMTDGTRVAGLLTGGECALWRLVQGTLSEGMSFKAEGTYLFVKSLRAAKLHADDQGLRLDAYAQINYYVGQTFDKRAVSLALKAELEALTKKLQAYGCDAFGFSAAAKRRFATYDEWRNARFKDTYRTTDIQINLNLLFTAQ